MPLIVTPAACAKAMPGAANAAATATAMNFLFID
jgi:hypothetical protein